MKIATVGIDLAKSVFQIHGVDARGKAVLRKQLKRGEMVNFFRLLPFTCSNSLKSAQYYVIAHKPA